MTSSGKETTDAMYEECRREEEWQDYADALQDEAELAIINRYLKQLNQERGAKTGAANRRARDARDHELQVQADAIWAQNPEMTKKEVARAICQQDPNISFQTVCRRIKKPGAG